MQAVGVGDSLSPRFADKYVYLLGIAIAKENNYSFVPPDVIKDLLNKGIIAPID